MNKYMVNMVHPKMIVQKGLKGCNSTRTVTTFAQKNRVPWVWWKPTANQKVMLVDWTQFRETWKKCGSEFTGKAFPNCAPSGRNFRGANYGYGASMTAKTMTKGGTGQTKFGYNRTATKKNERMGYNRRRAA